MRYTSFDMTALRQTAFRIPDELLDALQAIKERDGIPVSEQVRRALQTWIDTKGVIVQKTERKRVSPRKRP
jgi:hypothetical protein